jgi:6,7-dimethyl-8-ribityllumazine synthase
MAGDKGAGAPEGLDGSGLRIGVVRARWNSAIVDRLARGSVAASPASGSIPLM